MQSVGAVWVMVDLKGSSTEIALVQTATTLPVVCFGILGGALADLSDRRRLLLVTQAMMLVAAGALAVLDAAAVKLTVLDLEHSAEPLANAGIYLWHCNQVGEYSMYSPGVTNDTFCRGIQPTDADGTATFTTSGRTR